MTFIFSAPSVLTLRSCSVRVGGGLTWAVHCRCSPPLSVISVVVVRGRKPKPTHLKVIEGNPGKRPLSRNEPQPLPGVVKPSDLDPVASDWWDFYVPELDRMGLATIVDSATLEILSRTYSDWKRADTSFIEQELLVERWHGTRMAFVTNPLYRVVRDLGAAYVKLAEQYGLTASARARFDLPEPDTWSIETAWAEWQAEKERKEKAAARKAARAKAARAKRAAAKKAKPDAS